MTPTIDNHSWYHFPAIFCNLYLYILCNWWVRICLILINDHLFHLFQINWNVEIARQWKNDNSVLSFFIFNRSDSDNWKLVFNDCDSESKWDYSATNSDSNFQLSLLPDNQKKLWGSTERKWIRFSDNEICWQTRQEKMLILMISL